MKTILKGTVAVVPYFFMLLFFYAAANKMMDFENFQVQLAQSPLLSAYAGFISYAVIIIEVMIAGVLADPKVRRIGLYASFALMVAFTVYIYLILNYSDFVPCSCGGILEKMGWTEHLIFNIGCVVFAGLAIIIDRPAIRKTPVLYVTEEYWIEKFLQKKRNHWMLIFKMCMLLIVPSGLMVALFLSSEYIMKKENNFTRRFPHHPIIEEKSYDLNIDSYYFAGISGSSIYLGNQTSPFHILKIDTAFRYSEKLKIVPAENVKYRSLQYTVWKQKLYGYDGTIPIIFMGNLEYTPVKMKTISMNDAYFSQLTVLDTINFGLRTYEKTSERNVLGTLRLGLVNEVQLKRNLINTKEDGIFDSDGKLLYDQYTKDLYYLFYYRNQILIMNDLLTVKETGKTIDTVARSNIKTTTLKNGSTKISAPPQLVNRSMCVYKGLIFNRSNLVGKFETRDMWKQNAIVDVYVTNPFGYWGSLYVQNRGIHSLSQMLVTDRYLFVLAGNELVRYRLAQSITNQFRTGEAENLKTE